MPPYGGDVASTDPELPYAFYYPGYTLRVYPNYNPDVYTRDWQAGDIIGMIRVENNGGTEWRNLVVYQSGSTLNIYDHTDPSKADLQMTINRVQTEQGHYPVTIERVENPYHSGPWIIHSLLLKYDGSLNA